MVLVTYASKTGYFGGRDQEDLILRSLQANSSLESILKITNTKKYWWSGSNDRMPAWQA
jgi:hypothetical protein